MPGILAGFLAGTAKGAVDITEAEMKNQAAADLAQVNANIAVEREARIRENTRAAHAAAYSSANAAVPLDIENRDTAVTSKVLEQGDLEAANSSLGLANLERQDRAAKASLAEKSEANKTAAELKRQELKDKRELKEQELKDKAEARDDKNKEQGNASYSAQTARFNSIHNTIATAMGGKLDGITGQYTVPPDNAERYALAVSLADEMERLNPGALSPGELARHANNATSGFVGSKGATEKAKSEADPGFMSRKPDFNGKTQEEWIKDRARELVEKSEKGIVANARKPKTEAPVESSAAPVAKESAQKPTAPPPEVAARMIQALQKAKSEGKNAITLRDGSVWILGPDGQPQRAE